MVASPFYLHPAPPKVVREPLPEYLPARMLNEFVYCPRLFFYEWVEGLFRESSDTVEGSVQHRRVDTPGKALPEAQNLADAPDFKTRAVTLSSERYKLIAKIDLLEVREGPSGEKTVTPVDYKHGQPKENAAGELELWPADRAQLAAQALVLRDNGYTCDEALVFYAKTRQRVRLPVTAELVAETLALLDQAWSVARSGLIPAPLEDSPKCPGCSLLPICLPDEVNSLLAAGPLEPERQLSLFGEPVPKRPGRVRPLVSARDDARPVYLNTQGFRVGKSGDLLQVKEKDAVRQQLRLHEINQINLFGNIQISTQALQTLCEAGIPVSYFSQGGWFYGLTQGLQTKNVYLRVMQFKLREETWFRLRLARSLVAAKIRNHRTLLMRNHVEPSGLVLSQMKQLAERAEQEPALDSLLGVEGLAARLYFQSFAGMLKTEEGESPEGFRFDFSARNRRPPRDPVNALLSLGYSVLAKDFTLACYLVGFDPLVGYYHELRFGRPALALDLMEPFRALIVDSAVLTALNTGMIQRTDFVRSATAVGLTPGGRRAFFQAYEQRMDTLVTHPLFDYRVSYRRLLEIQARLLAKYMGGEIPEYPVFVTR
ncbi:MAG: CRISPR-associated endonuclease Cas1 [Bryobacteraceae bacterium]|nr:CRISPR-associated endonuclease Cas1 [Bryobacteraceae bacterium]